MGLKSSRGPRGRPTKKHQKEKKKTQYNSKLAVYAADRVPLITSLSPAAPCAAERIRERKKFCLQNHIKERNIKNAKKETSYETKIMLRRESEKERNQKWFNLCKKKSGEY